jgi:plasmid stabilization system protein ParE
VRIRVSARARREANRGKAWWRENRPATADLFTHELLHVLDVLRNNPSSGTLYEAVRFEAPVRRILMPKTEAHVYHATIDDEIVILAVWGARRRRGPKL